MPALIPPIHCVAIQAENALHVAQQMLLRLTQPTSFTMHETLPTAPALCQDIDEAVTQALLALPPLLQELAVAQQEDIDDMWDEMQDIALDITELRMATALVTLPKEAEGLRFLLTSVLDAPLFALLSVMQQIASLPLYEHTPGANQNAHDDEQGNAAYTPLQAERPATWPCLPLDEAHMRQTLQRIREQYGALLPQTVFTNTLNA